MNLKPLMKVAIFAVAGLLFILAISSSGIANTHLSLKIERVGSESIGDTNGVALKLHNGNSSAIILDPYCTIYWTDSLGKDSHKFYRCWSEHIYLDPDASETVILPRPEGNVRWNSSFAYQAKPGMMRRFFYKVHFYITGRNISDQSLVSAIGPTITNTFLSKAH